MKGKPTSKSKQAINSGERMSKKEGEKIKTDKNYNEKNLH